MRSSMNLLIVADDEALVDGFADHADAVDRVSIVDVRVDTGADTRIRIEGEPLDGYDAVYLQPDPRTAIFSKVFLEELVRRDIATNVGPEAFLILAKKPYLYQVLAERQVSIPATVAVSTRNGVSGVEDTLSFPLIGKKYERFERRDMRLLADDEELDSFAEHMDHGSHLLVLQDQAAGDVYDCLYIDGDIVSMRLEANDWRVRSAEANATYHSIGSDLQDEVTAAAAAVGADIVRVRLVGEHVVDVEPDPALDRFASVSGKNVYGSVASYLEV